MSIYSRKRATIVYDEDPTRPPEVNLVCAMLWRAYLDAAGDCEEGRISRTGFSYKKSSLHWLFDEDEEPENQATYLCMAAGLEKELQTIREAIINGHKRNFGDRGLTRFSYVK